MYTNQYKKMNPPKNAETQRQWYQKHKDKKCEYMRQYNKRNPQKRAETQRRWYWKNEAKILEKQKAQRHAKKLTGKSVYLSPCT